jgi:hypothetical protein
VLTPLNFEAFVRRLALAKKFFAQKDACKLFVFSLFRFWLWLSAGHYANGKIRKQGGVFAKTDFFLNS